jgi:hypothetical protein
MCAAQTTRTHTTVLWSYPIWHGTSDHNINQASQATVCMGLCPHWITSQRLFPWKLKGCGITLPTPRSSPTCATALLLLWGITWTHKFTLVPYCDVYATHKPGSSSDLLTVGYTLALNYVYTLAIQHYLSLSQFTVHCCGLLPPRTFFLAISCRELIWNCWELLRAKLLREPNWNVFIPARTKLNFICNSLYNRRIDHTENITASIVETCVLSQCIATVAALAIANPLLLSSPGTTSKHSFLYCRAPLEVSMASTVTACGKHATTFGPSVLETVGLRGTAPYMGHWFVHCLLFKQKLSLC